MVVVVVVDTKDTMVVDRHRRRLLHLRQVDVLVDLLDHHRHQDLLDHLDHGRQDLLDHHRNNLLDHHRNNHLDLHSPNHLRSIRLDLRSPDHLHNHLRSSRHHRRPPLVGDLLVRRHRVDPVPVPGPQRQWRQVSQLCRFA